MLRNLEHAKQQLKKAKAQLAGLDKLKPTVDQRRLFKNHYEKEISFYEGRVAALKEAMPRDHQTNKVNDLNVTFETITP